GLFGLWIWSLIHCINNKRLTDNNRIIGVILIVVMGLFGSLIYLFLPRERRKVRRPVSTRRHGVGERGRGSRDPDGSPDDDAADALDAMFGD
ncbi:MAG: PLDc N-terminal domain-containing protein, partial [Phycisphaeraceae bacterium]|nr:PLDc N-terminal domain-containing protein [Phycisphaeraceae bacterium]